MLKKMLEKTGHIILSELLTCFSCIFKFENLEILEYILIHNFTKGHDRAIIFVSV